MPSSVRKSVNVSELDQLLAYIVTADIAGWDMPTDSDGGHSPPYNVGRETTAWRATAG